MKAVNITLPTLPHHIEKKWTSMWGLGEMGSGGVQWWDLLVETDQAVQSMAFGEPLLGASSSKPTRGAGAQRRHRVDLRASMFNSKNLQGRIDSG